MRTGPRYALSLLPSSAKVAWLRARGPIGKRVHIGFGSIIVAEHAEIGDDCTIGVGTHIVVDSIRLGKRVFIGHRTQIRTNIFTMDDESEITHDVNVGGMDSRASELKMGKRSSIMTHSFVNTTFPVRIGNDVGIGGYCKIFTHGSWQSILEGYPAQWGPVTIEDNVWLPWDVFVLPNVTIGRGTTIGARSLVTNSIPAGCLAMGHPARVIKQSPEYPKSLTEDEKRAVLQQILDDMADYFGWKRLPFESVPYPAGGWELRGEDRSVWIGFRVSDIGGSPPGINLENKTDTLDLGDPWQRAVRDFLGRYGIRTENLAP